MNDLSSDAIGVFRRELRDTRSVVANIDHRTRRMVEPRSTERPAGLIARLCACAVLSRTERAPIDDIVRRHFGRDAELAQLITRAATGPAMTSGSGWASELVATVVADIADNLLPQSAFSQLRERGLQYMFIDAGLARVPTHSPTPSGQFVAEGGAIPLAALILGSLVLKPKKAGAICAVTKEVMQGSPLNVEQSLRVLLSEDLGLMIDGILLGSAAASAAAPAGLLNGVTPKTPTPGGGVNAVLGDVKTLLNAIAPAIRPVLVMNSTQATTFGILAPASAVPVIVAPTMTADSIAAVDAAAFASALGVPEFRTDEDPAIHMETAPLPIVGGTAQPPVIGSIAAPVQSLWQTEAIGIRSIMPCDWALRRANAVAVITGTTW
jgi:hypothetical protein